MEIATKLFDILKEKNRDILIKDKTSGEGLFRDGAEIKKYRQILRVACLLHDIGHFPFSHGSEEIWKQNHEKFGKDIILSDDIKGRIEDEKLSKMGIRAEDIAFIVANEPESDDARLHFLQDILTGDLGVDRIDYLVRDSLHSGVMYGMFDYHRLLDTFVVHKDEQEGYPILCLEKGGVNAAEGLILARYFMFLQVYYHKTRSAFDLHLKDYMKEFLDYSKQQGKDYSQIDDFVELTDFMVLSQMKLDSKLENGERRVKLAKMILNRDHHRIVDEINGGNLSLSENPDQVYGKIQRQISEEYKNEMEEGVILFDLSRKKTNNFEEANFQICDNGQLSHITTKSELIRKLKKIDIFRIYAGKCSGIEGELKEIINSIKEKYIMKG
jgi:HD superfamily phosphohydrolase